MVNQKSNDRKMASLFKGLCALSVKELPYELFSFKLVLSDREMCMHMCVMGFVCTEHFSPSFHCMDVGSLRVSIFFLRCLFLRAI